ncbi:glutamate--cysteine ligase [Nocardia otitidiscaviarum]|uniref:Putative glutamate--cysteine ligase 2 n=2 Tax=Nocardia otitidiscaviarum TaxID=1823 RepID=A0A378Y9T7_9NOCA|nr:glutamate--cysteine ligase [Nocardia otitidiscaviarum]MBF6137966.1 glutamate--cysteine ligase [Nocardia otitidiscaviarum]MBF6183508.1 glutamate--cysteine ligase [Nocardia otitidiscaviarum]MBF6241660.1 glutamate--cysteine ligase [Nocardia otitidiscaviarum]MBF6488965.1 glutamate--cysteine ligase [Nocardia otitidiscaviarum]SUA73854.1 Carboxylate-amine ligase YbdK [Nocardia otitidiscaviarum]
MGGADIAKVPFNSSPRPTLGVEWEVALVDKHTRDLSSKAAAVFDACGDMRAWDGTPQITKELLRNTVEIVSGKHDTVGEVLDELSDTMTAVRRAADPLGVDLFCAGTHPFAQWSSQQLTRTPHYDELIERTQWWGRQMLIWGVHVHVGVSHPDKVFPILNTLLLSYPHLLALSASSPMWAGVDTGYASNRALMFQQLPTAGLPFQFENWRQFEGFVHDQMKTGVFEQLGGMHWDIRPAPKWGTIEVRVCDGTPTRTELAALVSLIHCLIVDLDRRVESGETLPTIPPWHVQENKWRAARYGLDAIIITDADSNERLVTDDLTELLNRLEPTAKSLGCENELAMVAEIPKRGASYQRQRRVAAAAQGDLVAVVDSLVKELDQ